jgi:hypothetical protein
MSAVPGKTLTLRSPSRFCRTTPLYVLETISVSLGCHPKSDWICLKPIYGVLSVFSWKWWLNSSITELQHEPQRETRLPSTITCTKDASFNIRRLTHINVSLTTHNGHLNNKSGIVDEKVLSLVIFGSHVILSLHILRYRSRSHQALIV